MNTVVNEKPVVAVPVKAVEDLAENIAAIAEAMKALSNTRLKRRTLIVLIAEYSRVGRKDVEYVLNALEALGTEFLKPKPVPVVKNPVPPLVKAKP